MQLRNIIQLGFAELLQLAFLSLGLQMAVVSAVVSAETGQANTAPTQIVVFGDSLVAGFGLESDQAFPERLQVHLQSLGHTVELINAGVSGDTTASGLARLEWAIPESADGVVVELGANDALRGLKPAATEANLERIIERLLQRGQPVLLAGMKAPPNLGPEYEEQFNGMYERLARKYGLLLYPFFLDGVAARPLLNLEDGMHPNEQGIEIVVERIAPYAIRFLEEIRQD